MAGCISKVFKRAMMSKIESYFVKIRKFITSHPLVSLGIMMVVTSIIIYFPCLFLKQVFIYSDIGSDTENVYYPFFMSLSRKITNSDFSLWDFTYGTGTNILTRQADVASIFTWLTCIFGAKYIKYLLVVVQILKIILAGYAAYYYLNNFKYKVRTKILVSYIYAFNGFIILWGQHYFFAIASIYIALLLGSIEKALNQKRGYIYLVLTTFSLLCTSYYLGYMALLFAGVYVVFRMLHLYTFQQKKLVFLKLSGLLCSVIIGGLMSAFMFLPSVNLTVNSSDRLMSDMNFIEKLINCIKIYAVRPYDDTTVLGIISRIYSNNLMGAKDYIGAYNYYEMPQFFFTSLTVFIFVIYILEIVADNKEKKKIKALKFVEIFLILYLFFVPLFSVVFNGFVGPVFRYTFVIIPLFALCYAEIIDKIFEQRLRYKNFEISFACLVAVCVLSMVAFITNTNSSRGQMLVYIYVIVISVFAFCSVYVQNISKESKKKHIAFILCAFVIVFNICIESHTTTNHRVKISEENKNIYFTAGNDNVAEALRYLEEQDSSFYRVEKTFKDICELFNDSMIEGYYGVSTYNSVLNRNLNRFVEVICPEFCTIGIDGYNDFNGIVKDVEVVSMLGVKYILSHDKIDDIPQYEHIHTVGDVYIYQNSATEGIGKFYTKTISSEQYVQTIEEEKEKLLVDTLILEETETDYVQQQSVDDSKVLFTKPQNSSVVSGEVLAKQDGYVFVAIPFEDGWSAYIDGEEVEILQANIGYSAIRVEEGQHEILFEYNTPLLKEGIVISVIGILSFFGWIIFLTRVAKKEERR